MNTAAAFKSVDPDSIHGRHKHFLFMGIILDKTREIEEGGGSFCVNLSLEGVGRPRMF